MSKCGMHFCTSSQQSLSYIWQDASKIKMKLNGYEWYICVPQQMLVVHAIVLALTAINCLDLFTFLSLYKKIFISVYFF